MEPLGALGELVAFGTVGDDLAVAVEVAGVEDRRVEHALAWRARAAGRAARDLERAERAAEALVRLVVDVRIAHHKHTKARHRCLDGGDQIGGGSAGEIGAGELGGEQWMERGHLHRRLNS